MIVGVPKEVKEGENRVSVTPYGARVLVEAGHKVLIEEKAGIGSNFSDEEFKSAGAQVVPKEDLLNESEMIVKVKEFVKEEYSLLHPEQILFAYLHLAANKELTQALLSRKVIGIAYETVQTKEGFLPLLAPMSEIAGRVSIFIGAYYLAKPMGGEGILLSSVPGVASGKVVILGGGTVGINAAKIAAGVKAQVTILDVNIERLRYLDNVLPDNVTTLASSKYNLESLLPNTDLLIGAVLIPGAKAPHLVSRKMLGLMRKGAVIVDPAVDQGGCVETTRPTTLLYPTYEVEGIIHYCVANIPALYPRTSTLALTNATLPYVLKIANGYKKALREDSALIKGLNVYKGRVTHLKVAEAHNLPFVRVEDVLR